MTDTAQPVAFRQYQAADFDTVASLWTRINRELAPSGMEKAFERYIAMTIDGELKQLPKSFPRQSATPFGWSNARAQLSARLASKAVAPAILNFVECISIASIAAGALRNACSTTLRHKRARSDSRSLS